MRFPTPIPANQQLQKILQLPKRHLMRQHPPLINPESHRNPFVQRIN